MQDSFFTSFTRALKYLVHDTYAMIFGAVVSLLGYLLPVRNIVHLLLAFFIVDVFFGYWAAKKIRNEKFSVKIIWEHTIPRMLISIVLITGAFMWDKVYEQDLISTYKVIGWFISGVLLYSIADNGYQITKWSIFPKISMMIVDKVKASTGIDVEEIESKNINDESK
jgi:hypothetical protein